MFLQNWSEKFQDNAMFQKIHFKTCVSVYSFLMCKPIWIYEVLVVEVVEFLRYELFQAVASSEFNNYKSLIPIRDFALNIDIQ